MLTIIAKAVMYLNGTPVLGGVAAAAAILFLIAIIGLIAIVKHHQIILFFVSSYLINFYLYVYYYFYVICTFLNSPVHGNSRVYYSDLFLPLYRLYGSTSVRTVHTVRRHVVLYGECGQVYYTDNFRLLWI